MKNKFISSEDINNKFGVEPNKIIDVQALAGDSSDNVPGVPGIGVKRAVAMFEDKGYSWKTVVEAFKEKDLSEEIALMNARLARILTTEDYDDEKGEPILWNPPANYNINA